MLAILESGGKSSHATIPRPPRVAPGVAQGEVMEQQSRHRDYALIAYNNSFGGHAEKPQCERRDGVFG
jgi:hypothetical protein